MTYLLGILWIVGSFLMLKYRETLGDTIGEAEWMRKVGGVQTVLIFVSIFLFVWGIAMLTNTTSFLFGWIRYIIPGLKPSVQPAVQTGL
ncbi:hypothetical protein HY285_01905 [Candidatus Peregrinibacteria bacterium]|nr:hypothetical protein [Candidatus Peregrinibacteria bacterium]MBI3816280.1 hypothetical protein [Candidatus Peregrinibacteria bacterium]